MNCAHILHKNKKQSFKSPHFGCTVSKHCPLDINLIITSFSATFSRQSILNAIWSESIGMHRLLRWLPSMNVNGIRPTCVFSNTPTTVWRWLGGLYDHIILCFVLCAVCFAHVFNTIFDVRNNFDHYAYIKIIFDYSSTLALPHPYVRR